MNWSPKPQEIYKHFKGNLYQIITLAENSETGETLVIYQALYGEFKVYARPLEMFTGKVDKEKYPEVQQEYRFELQQMGIGTVSRAKTESTSRVEAGLASRPETSAENQPAEQTTSDICQPKEKITSDISQEEEPVLDPLVWDFLDADSHEQRLNILAALHHRITDDMITTMAIACDVEVPEGDLEERYIQLKNCLLMLDRFEIKRK